LGVGEPLAASVVVALGGHFHGLLNHLRGLLLIRRRAGLDHGLGRNRGHGSFSTRGRFATGGSGRRGRGRGCARSTVGRIAAMAHGHVNAYTDHRDDNHAADDHPHPAALGGRRGDGLERRRLDRGLLALIDRRLGRALGNLRRCSGHGSSDGRSGPWSRRRGNGLDLRLRLRRHSRRRGRRGHRRRSGGNRLLDLPALLFLLFLLVFLLLFFRLRRRDRRGFANGRRDNRGLLFRGRRRRHGGRVHAQGNRRRRSRGGRGRRLELYGLFTDFGPEHSGRAAGIARGSGSSKRLPADSANSRDARLAQISLFLGALHGLAAHQRELFLGGYPAILRRTQQGGHALVHQFVAVQDAQDFRGFVELLVLEQVNGLEGLLVVVAAQIAE